nr:FtsX-like permease family protein [Mycolicibacterium sp. CBMA 234]
MISVLHKKAARDLRRRLPQVAAVAVMVALGVMLFVASYDSFRNLQASYDQTYARTDFADLTVSGADADKVGAAVRGAPGVDRIAIRTVADVPMMIGATKLVGRVVGMPADGQGINSIDLTAGQLPRSDDVVVERHTADTFGLATGQQLRVFDGTRWHDAAISGVAESPEYLWPARSRQDLLDDPHAFAVVFTSESVARTLSAHNTPNQVLIQMTSTAGQLERDRVVDQARSAGATTVEGRTYQPSNAALLEGLKGVSGMAVGFPALFLTAAAISEFVLITRLIQTERPVIGTLLALGARRSAVVRHYAEYGAVIAAVAALAGVLAGAPLTSVYTAHYTALLGLPDTVIEHRLPTAVIGFALGLASGAIAGLAAAVGVARTAPAEAMRGDGTQPLRVGALTRMFTRWPQLPVVVRMALRSLLRSRRRTVATMVGSVLAFVLILASAGMLTSVRAMLDVQFGWVQRQDATVLVADSNSLGAQTLSMPGVSTVEPTTVASVAVGAHGRTYQTVLNGLEPATSMHRFRSVDGTTLKLPADGILAGAALADKLGVRIGDTITVMPVKGTARQMRLAGLLDEPLGTALYASNAVAHTVEGSGANGYLLRFDSHADRNQLRAAVTGLTGVVAYADNEAVHQKIDSYLVIFWVFAGVMLALGALLAFTVIYVTMTVNLAERTTEFATLRAAGAPTYRLTAAVAIENLAATLLAAPVGLAAGVGAAWLFLQTYNNDLFNLHLSVSPTVLAVATCAVAAAAAVSQLPAGRLINRIDVARVVRERSQ